MSELNWFVLRAVSGQEKKIKSYIENEITRQKLTEFVPQILIPSEKIYEMRNGKKRVREKNFFPGYIIISADLSKGDLCIGLHFGWICLFSDGLFVRRDRDNTGGGDCSDCNDQVAGSKTEVVVAQLLQEIMFMAI